MPLKSTQRVSFKQAESYTSFTTNKQVSYLAMIPCVVKRHISTIHQPQAAMTAMRQGVEQAGVWTDAMWEATAEHPAGIGIVVYTIRPRSPAGTEF